MTTLSPDAVAALVAIELNERLYRFPAGATSIYKAKERCEQVFSAADVMALVNAGYARESRVKVKGSSGSVLITPAGQAALLRGHLPRRGAA